RDTQVLPPFPTRRSSDLFQKLDRAMAGLDHLICFAVKSNSNLSILRLLANLGSGFDIVSGGELQRVISAGGDPAKCAFAGVGKTDRKSTRLNSSHGSISY